MNKETWLIEGDVGLSSQTMWMALMGLAKTPQQLTGRTSVPHDPDDFSRCYKLIASFPEWRGKLQTVADVFPAWQPYIREWDKMRELYIEESPSGKCPKLYELMQELYKESLLIDGWKQTGNNSWEITTP